MAKNGTITVKVLGDSSGLGKALDGAEKSLGKMTGAVAKIGAVIGAAFAVDKIVDFGRAAINAASDTEESLSKVGVVFGQNAKAIEDWASSAATNLGISKQEALEAAGTFGNLLTAMKLQPSAIKDMSTGMIQLASDLASFNNASPEETLLALRAGLTGETEPLKRFGINLNAARIEAKALEMGLAANKKEITAGAKAQAVYALIMEDSATAQGDFARTSDGLANKQRILSARFKDIQAQVGSFLLPIFLKLTTAVADGLQPAMEALGRVFNTTLKPAFETAQRGLDAFMEAFQGAGASTATGFVGAMSQVGDHLHGTIIPAFREVVGWVRSFVDQFRSGEGQVGEAAGKLQGIFEQVKNVVGSAFGAIRAVITTVVDFIKGVWRVFGDDIVSFTRELVAGVLEVVRGLLNALQGVFDLIKAVLTGKWGDAWEALKKIVDGVWDAIFGIVRNAVTNVIPTILAGLGQAVASVARTAFDGLKDAFKAALNWIIDRWNGLDFTIGGWKVGTGPLSVTLPEVTVGLPDIPRFHEGGIVPGRPGQEVPAILEAGERVIPANRAGAAVVVNVTSQADPWLIGREVAWAMKTSGV